MMKVGLKPRGGCSEIRLPWCFYLLKYQRGASTVSGDTAAALTNNPKPNTMMMKKLALFALAAPAFAGTPAPMATPAPAPAYTPACTLELGFSGNMGAKDLFKHDVGSSKEIDTVGIDLTAVRSWTPHHALTFRLGAAMGDETQHFDGAREKSYLRTISLMPGYRYTHPISDKTALYFGVNAGLVNQRVREKVDFFGGHLSGSDSAWGFGASGEVGVRYQLSPCTEVFAAYQMLGNTIENELGGTETNRQIHNGMRVGMDINF